MVLAAIRPWTEALLQRLITAVCLCVACDRKVSCISDSGSGPRETKGCKANLSAGVLLNIIPLTMYSYILC